MCAPRPPLVRGVALGPGIEPRCAFLRPAPRGEADAQFALPSSMAGQTTIHPNLSVDETRRGLAPTHPA